MKKALIVGGSNGIGLAVSLSLLPDYEVTVIDRCEPDVALKGKCTYIPFDLTAEDYSIFDRFTDTDLVMVTTGFGHLALFNDIDESLIARYFQVNTVAVMRIVKHFYQRLLSHDDFRLGVMVSIAGFLSSPFYSIYGATKAALKIFIESVNVELEKAGSKNRILNVSPGFIRGTHFNGGTQNDLDTTLPLAHDIVDHLLKKDDLFIPQYEEVYARVLERYHADFRKEGLHSYEYKEKRLKENS